jgi:hypothetical protein
VQLLHCTVAGSRLQRLQHMACMLLLLLLLINQMLQLLWGCCAAAGLPVTSRADKLFNSSELAC